MSTEYTFIVWADPGLLTGAAWYDLQSGDFGSGQYSNRDLERKLDALADVVGDRMAVGYERFNTLSGPRSSTPEHAHKAIQVIEGVVSRRCIPLLKPQPSSARTLGQIVYLRRLGWYKPSQGHANDAAQHVLAHVLRMKPMPQVIRGKLFPGYAGRGTVAT